MSHRWSIAVVALIAAALVVFQVRKVIAKDAIKDVVKDPSSAPVTPGSTTQPSGPLDFAVKDIDGKDVRLADFKGKVVMIVNVASKCGNTPQYAGLEKLYKTYKDQGFVILGFPANNFNHQEPGTDLQIKQFCTGKYDVTFPMMSKISVKGDDQAPLYKFLTEQQTDGEFAGDIDWNFAKFLVDRNGNVMARFAAGTKPDTKLVTGAIEKALAAK
jgi:glutathione peroxidase